MGDWEISWSRQRELGLHLAAAGLVGGDAECVHVTAVVQAAACCGTPPGGCCRPCAGWGRPRPSSPPVPMHLGEQLDHQFTVLILDQEVGCVPAQSLVGGVSEHLACLRAPEHDSSAIVQDDRRHTE